MPENSLISEVIDEKNLHTIVPCSKAPADNYCQLGDVGTCYSANHFRSCDQVRANPTLKRLITDRLWQYLLSPLWNPPYNLEKVLSAQWHFVCKRGLTGHIHHKQQRYPPLGAQFNEMCGFQGRG